MAHLFGRIDPVGCTCAAVRGDLAAGTSHSMCYLKGNTNGGGEVSRQEGNQKGKKWNHFQSMSYMWLASAGTPPSLDRIMLRSAENLPLELDIVCENWKNTNERREVSQSGKKWCAKASYEQNLVCLAYYWKIKQNKTQNFWLPWLWSLGDIFGAEKGKKMIVVFTKND